MKPSTQTIPIIVAWWFRLKHDCTSTVTYPYFHSAFKTLHIRDEEQRKSEKVRVEKKDEPKQRKLKVLLTCLLDRSLSPCLSAQEWFK